MKTRNIFALGAITVALLSGCSQPEQVETKELVRPASLYTVEDLSSEYLQNFPALIEPSYESDLAFRVSGELEKLNVVAGTQLKKGDIIAQLDPTDFEVQVERARAKYNLSAKTYERFKQMLALELTSQANFDSAEAQMILDKVALENAENNLEYTTLRAPYDGRVASVKVENHEVVQAKSTIITFHDEHGLDIEFQLPEAILSRVDTNAKNYEPMVVFTTSDEMQSREYRAQYKEIDTEVDPRSRSYAVTLHMETPETANLRPGMTATVRVELDKILKGVENYNLVPVEAVFSPTTTDPSKKKYAVWVVDQETMRVKQRMITVNGLTSQGMQVTSGLNKGEVVIAAGVNSIIEDTKVRAWIKERGI